MNKNNVEYLCLFLDYFSNISKAFFFFFVKRKSDCYAHIKKKGNEDIFTHKLLSHA